MHQAGKITSHAAITAIGSYVPERVLTNSHLEQMVETSHEWIVQRTGIVERRIAAENEYCSDLCIAAVRDLQARYGIQLDDVDYIITATSSPDTVFPSMSARVQAAFGIHGCGATDVQAACAGFVSALQLANGLLLSGMHRKILVIGAETLSKITDYTDRTTCILFGDGASAVIVERTEETGSFIASAVSTDGDSGHHLYRSALSSEISGVPITANDKIIQNGREVYKWAVTSVSSGVKRLLNAADLTTDQIDWFVPHSANLRMIESICERTGIPLERTLYSLVHYGNTSAASIPLALDLAIQDNRIRQGQQILLYGFGGGLTQAGLILRWMLP
ncbi:ketoacyl-ACP synthase III [Paenibacillus sambharensis]|uniref:Beta-ketoacyl-[acyl-carrier-protein] synthase III n=1 Tax=Paenibacillus sambharensis TaxID=1803190 RepID=A0A2W1LAE2_9BACL|nr:ketoacyl-ACP synthase III [Paenibacillus sambharensis]